MNNILNSGFSKYPLQVFVTKVRTIIAALTGNAYFPTTTPTMVQVQAALDALTQAMAMMPSPPRETAIEAARTALEELMALLADNLELTAHNDPVKLATTGFDMRKPNAQTGEPPVTPQNVRLKTGVISGEVLVMIDASDRAKTYQAQWALDPNAGPWTDYPPFSSSRGIVLRGLPRAKDIWIRIRAIGPNNTMSGWSDPATILVN